MIFNAPWLKHRDPIPGGTAPVPHGLKTQGPKVTAGFRSRIWLRGGNTCILLRITKSPRAYRREYFKNRFLLIFINYGLTTIAIIYILNIIDTLSNCLSVYIY